jgi:quinol monooxygenase YgiN
MMNDRSFRIVACLDVNQGQLPAFKSLVEKMALKVETSELRTLDYEWYLSGDGSQCYVSEWYADSDAYMFHYQHVQNELGELFGLAGLTAHLVFGEPDARVKKIHSSLGATFYSGFAGFTRRT